MDDRLKRTGTAVLALGMAGLTGAALEYITDPERGRRRRHLARERGTATLRRTVRRVARSGRRVGADLHGRWLHFTHRRTAGRVVPDEQTLTDRVESMIFRDPALPKGRININTERGVVILRGVLDQPEQIASIEVAVRRIPGVRDVENLLHLVGTPAPNKRVARHADQRAPDHTEAN